MNTTETSIQGQILTGETLSPKLISEMKTIGAELQGPSHEGVKTVVIMCPENDTKSARSQAWDECTKVHKLLDATGLRTPGHYDRPGIESLPDLPKKLQESGRRPIVVLMGALGAKPLQGIPYLLERLNAIRQRTTLVIIGKEAEALAESMISTESISYACGSSGPGLWGAIGD